MSDQRPPKRKEQGAIKSSRPGKKPKNSVADNDAADNGDQATNLAQLCFNAREKLSKEQLEETLIAIPLSFRSRLNAETERRGEELYDRSKEKRDLDGKSPSQATQGYFAALWRVCCRVFLKSPIALISPANALQYRPSHGKGGTGSYGVWSEVFSKALSQLIVHPCWRMEEGEFVRALQFAVKCRVGNSSPWPIKPWKNVDCPAIRALSRMYEQQGVDVDHIHEMHKEARKGVNPSTMSDFLVHLGNVVKTTASDASDVVTFEGFHALPVCLKDLKHLQQAVDSFNWPDESWRCSCEDIYKVYRPLVANDLPLLSDIKGCHITSLKSVFHTLALGRRRNTNDDGSPPRGSNDADNGQEDESSGGQLSSSVFDDGNEAIQAQEYNEVGSTEDDMRQQTEVPTTFNGDDDEEDDLYNEDSFVKAKRGRPRPQVVESDEESGSHDGEVSTLHGSTPPRQPSLPASPSPLHRSSRVLHELPDQGSTGSGHDQESVSTWLHIRTLERTQINQQTHLVDHARRLDTVTASVNTVTASVNTVTASVNTVTASVNTVTASVNEQERRLRSLELRPHMTEADGLRSQLATLTASKEDSERKAIGLYGKVKGLEDEKATLTKERDDLKLENTRLTQQSNRLNQRHGSANEDAGHANFRAQVLQSIREDTQLRQENDGLTQQLGQLRDESNSRIQTLEAEKAQWLTEREELKRLNADLTQDAGGKESQGPEPRG
ncbi:hypothetical protein F53441_10097 [Fusarium austroafricanum]|uniref:Uncharacterized protein n=1 Tax=Fusarium austroafricanum TaxID=2364996 RepID=A0A8H4K7M3_9HYPO|nr:hypothetical protein F53441_10097 [Fusarium austroafricanum]